MHIEPALAKRGTEHGSGLGVYRWVVERTLSRLHQDRRLRIRYERRPDISWHQRSRAPRFVCVSVEDASQTADHDIAALESALERYKLDMLKCPTTEDGLMVLVVKPQDEEQAAKWKGPYVKSINKDPWGKDYIYKCPGEHNESSFDLMSAGKDGEEGTEDDRTNWRNLP